MGIGTKIAGMGMYIPSIKVDNKKVIDLLRNQSRAYLQPDELDALIFEAEDKLEIHSKS